MNIEKIIGSNFLSFREVEYTLPSGVPVLIKGLNLTDDGQESNGSGKSALGSIIEYCILHATSRKTTDGELIKYGEDSAYIALQLYCPIRQQRLFIERELSGSGGRSQLSINGEVKFAFKDKMVNEIDRFIIDWIGITKEDLQNYFLISKFKYTSFFSSSNTDLVKLIGRFSNASIIEGIDKSIMFEVDLLTKSMGSLNDRKNQVIGMLEVHNKNLVDKETLTVEELRTQEIDAIDNKIIEEEKDQITQRTEISALRVEIQEEKEKLKAKQQLITTNKGELQKHIIHIQELQTKYQDIDTRSKTAKGKRKKKEDEQTEFTTQKSETTELLREIELNLKGTVTCPKCEHEFLVGQPDVDFDKEREIEIETKTILADIQWLIDETVAALAKIDLELQAFKRERSVVDAEEQQYSTMKRNLEKTISTIEAEVDGIDKAIKAKESTITLKDSYIANSAQLIETYKQKKVEISKKDYNIDEEIKALKSSIKECEDSMEDVDEALLVFLTKQNKLKQWALSYKEFVQHLSTKTLKVLQGYANKYLNDFGLDLRVQLSGFKMKSDGTLSDKITATIFRGEKERSFGSFSGGERARLEAAMILTIHKAINSTHKFGGFDFLIIDEVLESSDAMGLNSLMRSFKELHMTIMLITQLDINSVEYPILQMVKEYNESKIKELWRQKPISELIPEKMAI